MKEEILMLKIHNGLKDGKDFYEATRGNWKIKKMRFEYIQYVVGIDRGKVICIFEPERWFIIENGPEKGRKYFKGKESRKELLLKFKAVEEHLLKKIGSGSAIAYEFLSEIN